MKEKFDFSVGDKVKVIGLVINKIVDSDMETQFEVELIDTTTIYLYPDEMEYVNEA